MTEVDAKRLGDLVRARRRELKLTQADVQELGGPSTATLRLIEGGKHTDFRNATAAPLEQILQWEEGSISAVLEGKQPTPHLQTVPAAGGSIVELAESIWALVNELADSPEGDPQRPYKAVRAVLGTADILIDVLLALNAGPPAKQLIQEMSNKAYELLHLDKENEDDLEAAAESDASSEAVEVEEDLDGAEVGTPMLEIPTDPDAAGLDRTQEGQ